MDLKSLRAGDKVIFKDSKVISKYAHFKDGDILTMENDLKSMYEGLDQDHLKAQLSIFKREPGGLRQEIFLRDIQPLEQSKGKN